MHPPIILSMLAWGRFLAEAASSEAASAEAVQLLYQEQVDAGSPSSTFSCMTCLSQLHMLHLVCQPYFEIRLRPIEMNASQCIDFVQAL